MNRKLSYDADFPDFGFFENPLFENPMEEDQWLQPYENQSTHSNVKKCEYSPQEDDLILDLVEQYGRRWKKIASHFKGRSSRMIRNRYMRILKKRNELTKKPSFDKYSQSQTLTPTNNPQQQTPMTEELGRISLLNTQLNDIQLLIQHIKEDLFSYIVQNKLDHIPANADKPFQNEMVQQFLRKLEL